MKKIFAFFFLFFMVFALSARAAENTPTLFPALHPGMTIAEAKAIFPKMTQQQGAEGSTGFTISDTPVAGNIKLLFVEGKLAMMAYMIRNKKLSAVIAAAKSAYGEQKEGDGVSTFKFETNGSALEIYGDIKEGGGSVTFVDPAAMKKIGGK